MDAIVLAGGSGSRMGNLTVRCNKGALAYRGRPLVSHVLDRITSLNELGTIHIATRYEADSIRDVVSSDFGGSVRGGKIHFDYSQHIIGDFKRLAYTLEACDVREPCMVCGIDVLAPVDIIHQFLGFAAAIRDPDLVILASPRIDVAPTHTRVYVEESVVKEYAVPNHSDHRSGIGWYSSLNICLLSARLIHELRANPPEHAGGLVRCASYVWRNDGVVYGFTFGEPWQHFGVPQDLARVA